MGDISRAGLRTGLSRQCLFRSRQFQHDCIPSSYSLARSCDISGHRRRSKRLFGAGSYSHIGSGTHADAGAGSYSHIGPYIHSDAGADSYSHIGSDIHSDAGTDANPGVDARIPRRIRPRR